MESVVWRSLTKSLKKRIKSETAFTKVMTTGCLLFVGDFEGLSAYVEPVRHPSQNSLTLSVGWAKPGYSILDIEVESLGVKSAVSQPLGALRIGSLMGHRGDYWWNLRTASEKQAFQDAMFAAAGLHFDLPFPGTDVDEPTAVEAILNTIRATAIPFLQKLAQLSAKDVKKTV